MSDAARGCGIPIANEEMCVWTPIIDSAQVLFSQHPKNSIFVCRWWPLLPVETTLVVGPDTRSLVSPSHPPVVG